MWVIFIMLFLAIFFVGIIGMYLVNKVVIEIKKDNDKYEKEKDENEY